MHLLNEEKGGGAEEPTGPAWCHTQPRPPRTPRLTPGSRGRGGTWTPPLGPRPGRAATCCSWRGRPRVVSLKLCQIRCVRFLAAFVFNAFVIDVVLYSCDIGSFCIFCIVVVSLCCTVVSYIRNRRSLVVEHNTFIIVLFRKVLR